MVGKMKEKLKMTKEQARQILWEDTDDFIIIQDEQVDSTRWSAHHDLVVQRKEDSKFFRAGYSVGLTEQQDERPWEYEDEVEFVEVTPSTKTITVYV